MTMKSALVTSTGLKAKRSTSTKKTISVTDPNQIAYLDLDVSFSYGSSDEEDGGTRITQTQHNSSHEPTEGLTSKHSNRFSTSATGVSMPSNDTHSMNTNPNTNAMRTKKSTYSSKSSSKKMFARRAKITVSPSNRSTSNTNSVGRSGSSSGSGSSKFLPLSQREKMKRASKMMKDRQEQQQQQDRQEPPVTPNLTLADLVRRSDADGKKLYSDSWRIRNNNKNKSTDSNLKSIEQQRDQNETLRDDDDDNDKNHSNSNNVKDTPRNFFECLLSSIVSGAGCGDYGSGMNANSNVTSSGSTNDSINNISNRDIASTFGENVSITSTEISGDRMSSTASITSDTDTSLASIVENVRDFDKYSSASQSDEDLHPSFMAPSTAASLDACIDAIKAEKWNVLLRFITANPKLLSQTSRHHRNKNLLHILSGQHSNIPTVVIVTMINLCPDAVSQPDQDGCIPLHHMVFTGGKDDLVKILLESWSEGTTIRNVDGDLPLHVSVWAGKGNERVAEMIMDAYPQAVGEINNASGTPLHLACCETNASPSIVQKILQMQLSMDIPFNMFDSNGNTPLHVAIKTKAPLEVIVAIYTELGSGPFSVSDKTRLYPLQMAMSIKDVNPEVVDFICTAAPQVMKKQMTNGMMPVFMAAEQNMPSKVVKKLLLADSPIKFMPLMAQLHDVVLRTHSQSWWNLMINDGRYAPVIDDILSNVATIHEVVSLCQEPDSNGHFSVFERAHADIKDVMLKNLIFCDRYRVAPEYKATVVKGLLLLCAVETMEDEGFVERNPRSAGYVPTSNIPIINREVLLHCCVKGSYEYNELVAEIRARDEFNFSDLHSQSLFRVQTVDAKKIGCTGDMLCLAFERPLLTLQEIFETSRFRKRKNQQWARKSLNLLLCLARALKYFHSSGHIHGSVEPATIGKFQGSNNWKMLDMRRVTPIGKPMRGELRYGAPPEGVSTSQVRTGNTEVKKLVSFDENFVKGDILSQDSDESNGLTETLEFNPGECLAEITWDIWSFGLIMGQLVLGQSMVLLPNFEKASDAHLKRLHNYDDTSVKKIYDAARRVSGENAAKLLSKLLQPRPEDRPQSMDEVLNYNYFSIDEAVC